MEEKLLSLQHNNRIIAFMEILIDSLYSIVNYKSRYLKLKEILEGIPVSEYKVIIGLEQHY